MLENCSKTIPCRLTSHISNKTAIIQNNVPLYKGICHIEISSFNSKTIIFTCTNTMLYVQTNLFHVPIFQ